MSAKPPLPNKLNPGRLQSTTALPGARQCGMDALIPCGGHVVDSLPDRRRVLTLTAHLTPLFVAGTAVPGSTGRGRGARWHGLRAVCRLPFSHVNGRVGKSRRRKRGGKQLTKDPQNNGGHVPAGSGCCQHNGFSAPHEWAQLLQTT